MSDYNSIILAVEGNINIITLNLPQKLNALTTSSYHRIDSLVREADANPNTFVTLIIGTGRFFSACFHPTLSKTRTEMTLCKGADLQAGSAATAKPTGNEPRMAWLPALVNDTVDVPSAFFSHSKILICALNGPVLGL